MAKGGAQPGSGRPAGAATKRTRELADEFLSDGKLTPMAYLFGVLRDEEAEPGRRDDAAKTLMSYCHPRLQTMQVTGKDGGPIETQEVGDPTAIARRLLFFINKAAKQKEPRK